MDKAIITVILISVFVLSFIGMSIVTDGIAKANGFYNYEFEEME